MPITVKHKRRLKFSVIIIPKYIGEWQGAQKSVVSDIKSAAIYSAIPCKEVLRKGFYRKSINWWWCKSLHHWKEYEKYAYDISNKACDDEDEDDGEVDNDDDNNNKTTTKIATRGASKQIFFSM